MTPVSHYTAVALFVVDTTSSPLSWEGCALAYAGHNLRTCLRMFHALDSYVYSCSKMPTIATRVYGQTTPCSSIGQHIICTEPQVFEKYTL